MSRTPNHAPINGSIDNLLHVYSRSLPYERDDGYNYYELQRSRMQSRATTNHLSLETVTAAFCALSPNNNEATNYFALDTCLQIYHGKLPDSHPVVSYGSNKAKALAILRGADIDSTLRGQKVYSFYRNTLEPDNDQWVTIDGHMHGAWIGKRLILRRNAEIKRTNYPVIVDGFRQAARQVNLSAPRFQAILWLTWKRLHRILWAPPQLSFWSPEKEYAFVPRPGSREPVGRSTAKVTLSTPAVQQLLEFDAESVFIG